MIKFLESLKGSEPFYKFWSPHSGFYGGIIMGTIIVVIIMAIKNSI